MTDPVEFSAILNLQTAIAAIRMVDGYHRDVQATAVKLDPDANVEDLVAPSGPRPFVLIEVKPEIRDYATASRAGVKITLPVVVHWVSDSVPTDDQSRLRTFFEGCADIERAVTRDLSRGGIAFDTRIVRGSFDSFGVQVWASIDVEIRLQRVYGEPNVQSA